MNDTVNENWPLHEPDEINAVLEVLASGKTNYWTGTKCREFEKAFAGFIGTDYAIAVSNGTAALEAALYALDIGPGDEVITTCRTFIASAACIVMRGATPVLADIDPASQNITALTIEPLITSRTKAILVVHLAGWPAEMTSILALAKKYHLKVIEDCAQAHGAMLNQMKVGSFGDIAAFSFCQDKIMTTGGEGGMITTNDAALWEKAWSYKDHGRNYQKVYASNHPPGFRWLHDHFGTNLRMTEIQAAIGLIQLKKLPQWLSIRQHYAAFFNAAFAEVPGLHITLPPPHVFHAYYKYYVLVNSDKLSDEWNRDRIMQMMNAANLTCLVGSCPDIGMEQAFQTHGMTQYRPRPNAHYVGTRCLMLQVHPSLTLATIEKTAQHLTDIVRLASHKQTSLSLSSGT